MSNRQIAQLRGTSLDAVKYHLGNIRLKLMIASRDELIRWQGTPLIPVTGAEKEMPMLVWFDLHAETERLATTRSDFDDPKWIEIRTFDGEVTGKIREFLPQSPRWSPDGSQLAFFSGDGILYVYDIEEASTRVIFKDDSLLALFPEWSPDASRLVFSGPRRDPLSLSSIYCIDLRTKQVTQLTDEGNAVDFSPVWSPSGRWISFGRRYLDEPDMPKWAHFFDIESGHHLSLPTSRCIIQRSGWSPDSSLVLVRYNIGESRRLEAVRLEDMTTVWGYESDRVRGGAFSPKGDRILCVCADELLWLEFPTGKLLDRLSLKEYGPISDYGPGPSISLDNDVVYFLAKNSCIYRWNVGDECVPILKEDPKPRPRSAYEEYSVPSRDGRLIPVRRFVPPNPKTPAILYVHAGPKGRIDPDNPFLPRLLPAGLELVCPAYRGIAGYGKEHEEASRGEYGRVDVWDVVACGLDWKKRYGGDRPLVFVGFGYGGFLGLLALAQVDAPWDGGIIVSPLSGLHRVPHFFERALPEDPSEREIALIKRSPLEQAKRIRVPVLIIHGERSILATTEELTQIQQRIRSADGECELTVFEDETHGLLRHRDEVLSRIVDFLKRFS